MTLPQLPREPVRPELEGAGVDKELWQPKWKCFCCHDSGLVWGWLINLVIPGYDPDRDKPVACQRPHCEAGATYRDDPNYDQRFTSGICMELDRRSREDWRRTVQSQFELIQNRVKDTARGMSMRKRDRTKLEEMEVQRRHEEVCNADLGKLTAMATAYLGSDYMKDGSS